MRGDDMPSNLEKLRERVYGSANPTKEQVQVVRNRASTLSSAAPSWAQPKGRVASPSLPTASGTKGTQTDESRADAIREALVRLDAIEQTRAAAPRLTAEGLEREALEEIGREFGLDSQQTRTAYTARKALEEDLDRITNPRRKAGRAENGGKIEGAYSFGKSVEGAVVKGLEQVARFGGDTFALAEDIALAPFELLSGNDLGTFSDKGLLNRWAADIRKEQEAIEAHYAPNATRGGKAAQIFEDLGASTVAALPQAVLALLTGGGSAAAQTTAGLTSTAAQAVSPGVAATVQGAVRSMAKNPQYWTSFAQVVGSSYEDALDDMIELEAQKEMTAALIGETYEPPENQNAMRAKAALYAIGNGLMNAAVEIGGGIQTLPDQLRGGQSAWKSWVEAMVDEGKEEVVQGVIERALQNPMYGAGNPLFSTTDERAIFNPATAAQEFAGGAVVGGVLGGGQIGAARGINAAARRAAEAQARRQAETASPLPSGNRQAQGPQITQAVPAGTQNAAPEGAAQVQQDQAQPAGRQTQATAADPVIQTLESGRRVDQAALSNEQFAVLAERGDMNVDAVGRVYQVDPAQHIDQRSSEDMGDRRINAFQFDHPEVHRYYSEAAAELLNELSVTEKGGQTLRLGDYQTGYEYRRTKRAAPERITVLLDDYGLSYDQIEKALDAIIHNHGQENIAAAKRVEFVLDDMLTNGYQSMDGYIPPNQDYINAKASIAGYVEPAEGGSAYLDGIDEAPATAERTEQNGQQGAEPGDGVSDGDLGRLSGTGAGEQTGGVGTGAERGRGPTDTFRAARERQNSVHDLRGEPVSSRDLGLRRGTDAKTLQVIPESAWDDSLRATADRVREETGLDTVFVTGGIQIGTPDGARLVRGAYTGGRIIVQADNIRVTPDQIADHEIFHDRAAQTPGLIRELEDRIREQYGPEELGRVVEQYTRKLRGVIDVTENAGEDRAQAEAWAILEEIFADAYAGINAFSVHAERFNETVEQTMTERGVGRGSQNAAATDRTTGPPEGRQSIDENYEQNIDDWAAQGRPDGEIFILGSTGDVLQGLGAMEQDIYLRSEKVNTILQQHPEMTLAEIKRIPEILDDPVLVLKSRNVGRGGSENSRMVIFGTVTAQDGRLVLVALDLMPTEGRLRVDDMQKVTSAYTKDTNPVGFLTRSEVLYADKKRTAALLRRAGFQMPTGLLRSGSMGSITYGSNTVNMQGVPFDQVVETTEQSGGQRYSFGGENAQRADLEALDRAQDMERRGVAMETIFRETGWYTGADGKWRFEIDDSGMEYDPAGDLQGAVSRQWAMEDLEAAKEDLFGSITQEQADMVRAYNRAKIARDTAEQQRLYDELTSAEFGFLFETYADALERATAAKNNPQGGTLADYINHPELFANYPQLRQAGLQFANLSDGTRGRYNTESHTITLDNSLRGAPEDTLVHEIQHAIQSAEGFSGGSSPEYWARREFETGDLVTNRLQQEYDQILNGLGREDQNKYIRYTELERELERLFLADSNTEAGRRYDRLEAEQDAIYEELYPNAWFRQLLDLSRRMEDTAGEYRRMYENTAGEIEARDVTARRQLTPEQRRQTMPNTGDENTVFSDTDAFFSAETDTDALKERQMQIIQETNPADDDYHTWIRSAEEIKTFREAIEDPEWAEYDEYNPDFTRAMAEEALESGEIEVFSSYPIEAGGFVSPSRMEAESYSGNGRVYSKTVPLTDVAWIDPTQGQYAPVDRTMYSMSEPTDAQWEEANQLFFQGVDADTIREMTGLERTEDGDWRFAVDTAPAAAYDGGRTTDQQGGADNGQDTTLRGIYGDDVRGREAGETIPGRPRSAQRRNAAGSQTDEGGRRAAPASWARGRVIDRPSRAAGIAAENAGRYGADAFVVEDAAIKERNPKAWALTSGGSIYISDSIPAELADVVGYHEAIHAAKQTGNDRYLDFLENTGEYISLSSDRTAEVMGMIIKQRFHGSKSLFDLTPQEQTTAFDELNAVVWGFHKADQENAREQFADMFQDYDAYIADLDAAMESGAEPEVPGLSLPTLDDEDIRYSMDEDTAAEPSDNPPLSPDQSGRSDLHRPRGMSDEQYNRLNERWKNRPVDWRETLAPEGFDSIDDYTAALEAAAEERMRNRSREEFEGSDALKDLGIRIANSVGLYGNTQQLIENDRAAKSIRKEIKRAERRLQATDAEKNFASGVAAGIYGEADIPPSMDADTVMELADYYWAEKAVQNDLIREQRTKINRNLDERVRRLMDGVDDAKTKVPAAVIMRNRTPERNMRRIFGNAKGDEINDYLFRPVQDNEAERIRFVNRMHNEVRTFKDRNGKDRRLNKEERALVQLVIEGRAAEDAVNAMERSRDIQNAAENIKNARKLAGKDDLAKRRQAEIDASVDEAREFNLGTDERRLAIQYSRWLETQERLQGADTTIIGNAVEKYRELFNQLYDAANDFLVAHGYEPIGFIRGYAPHLQSQETQERFNNALERMGINREIGKLPTSIAGRTKNFKPNMPWNGFFKNRNSQGEFLDPDIAEGFEKYVDSMSDVLYHTDDIMRTRAFVRYFRRTYAPEEIRNQLEQADAVRYAQADQQASFLRDKGKLSYTSAPTYEDVHQAMEQYVEDQYQAIENLTLYGDLAVFLDDYANNLANKQLFEDRAMEKSFGRTSLNAISKVRRAFARAQVSANLSSALNQGGQLPIILAENGARNVAQALIELRSKDLKSWAAGSDFLTEKKGINYIVTSWKDRAITGAFKPLEIVDGIVSTLAVRSRYLKEVRAGKSAAEAMRLADRFGREVMASRAKGSVPLAFRSKDFLNQMVHMFQLEALNNWEHVTQDLGNRDFREMVQAKGKRAAAGSLAAILVKIILGAFLLNRIDEELYGGTPAPFDILGLAGNVFAGGLGLTQMDLLETLVDNGWERLTGERLFDTDPELNEFDAAAAFDDFVWNGLNEIPFASNVAALAGMGDRTLPMPDLSNLADLPGTIAEDGLFSWEVARQLAGLAGDVLPGGRQIEKSIQGGEALLRGGYYRGSGENRRLQFPVEQDFWSIVRGTLFGRSALDESRDFYASGQTGLSANQTKAYEQILDMGADPQTVYQAIQGWRAAENDEALNSYGRGVAKRDAITEADLTDEQKLALYRGLSDADSSTPDHFRAMMDTGLSWEEVMEAYDQYQFLNSDEDTPEAERLSASEKATEFASWVERQNYTEDQAETVKEALRYWQMIPAEASEKILLAQEYGVSDSSRKAAAEEIDRLKGDGNSVTQDMAAEALENMPGLDNRERAILWQLQNKSWKWNKNPFDKRVGREVYDRMHEEDEA